MNILSMVEAKLPPGFRFHPRDEELICDYLAAKLAGDGGVGFRGWPIMVEDVDLNKCEPWDLPGQLSSLGIIFHMVLSKLVLHNHVLAVMNCLDLLHLLPSHVCHACMQESVFRFPSPRSPWLSFLAFPTTEIVLARSFPPYFPTFSCVLLLHVDHDLFMDYSFCPYRDER